MAKPFKLRLSRVLQICRSKHPPIYPQKNPSRAGIHRLFPAKPKTLDTSFTSFTSLPDPPPSTPDDSFIARHVASVRCGSCAGADSPSEYTWQQDGRWHVVSRRSQSQSHPRPRRKICGDSRFDDGDVETTSPVLVRQGDRRIKQKKKKKKKKSQAKGRTMSLVVGRSVTSSESGWFSSEGGSEIEGDDDDETDALLSTSRSFSNDTLSDFYRTTRYPLKNQATEEMQNSPQDEDNDENRIRRLRCYTSGGREDEAGERRRGAVMGESVAVVKRSDNPLEDFKRSMAEMIVEKRMFGAGDLEQLLQCFLSLNSRHYHGVIVEAFAEIWQVLFVDSLAAAERRRTVSPSASVAVEHC